MTQLVNSQCPECGFDLEPGKACRVCGYQQKIDATNGQAAPRHGGRRGTLGVLASSAIGLLAILGIFIYIDMRGHGGDSDPAYPATFATPTTPAAGGSATTQTAEAAVSGGAALAAGTSLPSGTSVASPALPNDDPAPPPGSVPKTSVPRPASTAAVQALMTGPILLYSPEQNFDISTRAGEPPASDKASFIAWMLANTDQKQKFLAQKWDLAQVMLRIGSIRQPRLLEAFLRTPREFFCRDTRRAYEDAVLPIGFGQTISGPHMVGRMTDYLDPQPDHKVLEIGTGSGYQSAVLSELSNHVYTIEIVEALARETDAIYRKHEARYPEYRNIHRKVDDGYYGWAEYAPFDRIIVTCGIDHVPPELLQQLAPEGIMVIPVGPPSGQTILRIMKHVAPDGSVTLDREDIFQGKRKTIFVPFTSREGGVHKAADTGALK